MIRHRTGNAAWAFVILVSGIHSPAVRGGEKPDLTTVLERRIIDPSVPLQEVQRSVLGKIVPLPDFKTAAEWEGYAAARRQETLDKVVFRGEAESWRRIPTKVEWLQTIDGGPGYQIRKLRFEAVPGMWIPGLLYLPTKLEGKVPVCLNVNGHDRKGKAADYKQLRCINQVKRGMIALNLEWVGMGQLATDDFRHYRMNQLDLCGTSGVSPFYLSMSRGLDVLLSLENADPTRVAVSGLSGGGWQTIFISGLDTRVTLSNPVAGYSSFITRVAEGSDLGDSEQTPVDLGMTADYIHLTAFRAPKPTLLTFNAKDNCCFKAGHALPPLRDACTPIYGLYGKEASLRSHVNEDPGDHNFGLDNRQQLYRMLGDFFFPGRKDFDWKEIDSSGEVKTAEELSVELPEKNAGFNTIALRLAEKLPRVAALPAKKEDIATWTLSGRAALAEFVRNKEIEVEQAMVDGEKEIDGGQATFWRIKLGGGWTVPATELVRGTPQGTVIVLADVGRASAAAEIGGLLDRRLRVIAIDPFYFGESKFPKHDVLWGLMVATVGDRPLGLQSRQVGAIARWAGKQHKQPVQVAAVGPRTSLIALTASALEPDSFAGVELRGSLGSLKEILEQNQEVTKGPESFCSGLLEKFDILQLAALSVPRPVKFVEPSERVSKELSGLKAYYSMGGLDFNPLP